MSLYSRLQAGVALVEFALILPVLLVLTVATTEIGRALYEYNIVAKAVRNAARFMSMQDPADTEAPATARRLILYGRPAADDAAARIAPGFSSTEPPRIEWLTAGTNPTVNYVTVTVTNYTFTPMISQLFGLQIGNAGGIIFPTISASMRGQL